MRTADLVAHVIQPPIIVFVRTQTLVPCIKNKITHRKSVSETSCESEQALKYFGVRHAPELTWLNSGHGLTSGRLISCKLSTSKTWVFWKFSECCFCLLPRSALPSRCSSGHRGRLSSYQRHLWWHNLHSLLLPKTK